MPSTDAARRGQVGPGYDRRAVMADLREELFHLQGNHCAIPGCSQPWSDVAHIQPSGMGGRPSTYTAQNVAGLCRPCHDTFDGRDLAGRQDMLRRLLAAAVHSQRQARSRYGADPH